MQSINFLTDHNIALIFPAVHHTCFHQGVEETVQPFFGFAVSLVVGMQLVHSFYTAYIINISYEIFSARLC